MEPHLSTESDVRLDVDLGGGTNTASGPGMTYQAGRLWYTRGGLVHLFCWLLGGDFAFSFFEQIFGRFIPLYAKDLQASNTLIGIMTGSIAGLMNALFLPNISMSSDRHRGPLGRRIPFLLWATPCTVGALLLIGFAPELGHGVHALTSSWLPVTETATTLALLCLFVVVYHFSNMVLVNTYNWLIRDVVPTVVMGRFLSWFRVVTTLSAFIFLWWVFPRVTNNREAVFVTIGLVYVVAFAGMCWQIREGAYPPPQPVVPGRVKMYMRFFRQCLSVAVYRNFFMVYVLMVTAITSATPFLSLFARDDLGLGMGDLGRIFAWGTLAAAVAYPPIGFCCDRFRPIWVMIAGIAGIFVTAVLAYFYVHDRTSWLVYTIVSAVPLGAWTLGCSALTMELFPVEEFGQFSAGLNVFGYGGLILGNYLAGVFMDLLNSHYHMAFLWSAVMSALAIGPAWLVYQGWKRHGGPHCYRPPLHRIW